MKHYEELIELRNEFFKNNKTQVKKLLELRFEIIRNNQMGKINDFSIWIPTVKMLQEKFDYFVEKESKEIYEYFGLYKNCLFRDVLVDAEENAEIHFNRRMERIHTFRVRKEERKTKKDEFERNPKETFNKMIKDKSSRMVELMFQTEDREEFENNPKEEFKKLVKNNPKTHVRFLRPANKRKFFLRLRGEFSRKEIKLTDEDIREICFNKQKS